MTELGQVTILLDAMNLRQAVLEQDMADRLGAVRQLQTQWIELGRQLEPGPMHPEDLRNAERYGAWRNNRRAEIGQTMALARVEVERVQAALAGVLARKEALVQIRDTLEQKAKRAHNARSERRLLEQALLGQTS